MAQVEKRARWPKSNWPKSSVSVEPCSCTNCLRRMSFSTCAKQKNNCHTAKTCMRVPKNKTAAVLLMAATVVCIRANPSLHIEPAKLCLLLLQTGNFCNVDASKVCLCHAITVSNHPVISPSAFAPAIPGCMQPETCGRAQSRAPPRACWFPRRN